MKKPDSLKKLLLATVPGLVDSPETLQIFVDRGRIAGGGGRTLSFEYRYAVNVVLEAYAGDIDAVTVPILAWLAENQPELLDKPTAEPFAFEAELLDGKASDISITIELTEVVLVTPREGGGYGVSHPATPVTRALDRFADVPCGAKLWQLSLGRDIVAQTTDPAFVP
jgi:hypothetical protein